MTALATSLAARSSPRPAATQRRRVFLHLLHSGSLGATLEEIEQALGMPGNTVRPRRIELEAKNLVKDSGSTRPTASGRAAVVWIVPEPVRSLALAKLAAKGLA